MCDLKQLQHYKQQLQKGRLWLGAAIFSVGGYCLIRHLLSLLC